VAVGVGLILHELPQEILEYAVFIRAGYSKTQAVLRNFLSASSIIVGTFLTIVLASHAEEYLWVITGLAAGNLLYLAATDLLPRAHGDLKNYGGFRYTALAVILGFAVMTTTIHIAHERFGHGHSHEHGEHHDEHEEEDKDEHQKKIEASRAETEAARQRSEELEGELEVI
jgi:zinc and cadmium transporter